MVDFVFMIVSFVNFFSFQVNYYVQSHIQMNEYRDRVVLVSASDCYIVFLTPSFPLDSILSSLLVWFPFFVLAFCNTEAWTAYWHLS